MTTYKWLSHWKTCTSGSVVKSWPMMSKVSGSNPAATKVFFRGLNDVYVCHVTWNTKMTTSDRKKKFSTWNHIENACRKLTESWDGSSLIRSSSRRPWNFPDGQMVPGRYTDAVCYQGCVWSLRVPARDCQWASEAMLPNFRSPFGVHKYIFLQFPGNSCVSMQKFLQSVGLISFLVNCF